ncbi:TetR/AcrR family transcriptional regulator [Paenibacillus sp.]|uniref:TetR/AcrR family transcriptional regulator n=1 Tax=Paenibacillus sp. TaxID=58172 RepID=UPI0028122785|nr:TetR/AcrR family transcriptional regulator [Paenibacillus sp.]
MVKRFSESEKEVIRSKLVAEGRELFAERGLQKTGVAEITSRAGIAQGTFYLFFDSKEALFFEILQREEENIRTALFDKHLTGDGRVSREGFERFLMDSLFSIRRHPLIRHLYDERTMESLFRKLPPETLAAHASKDEETLLPFIDRGQREGWLVPAEPGAIVNLIRSAVLLSFQRERIGEPSFDATLRLLAHCIACGLILEEGDCDASSR